MPVVARHEPHEHVGLVGREDDLAKRHVVVLPRVRRVVLDKGREPRHQLPVRLKQRAVTRGRMQKVVTRGKDA